MRLLGLNNTYPPAGGGGYAEICADVMGGLARRGHRVRMLTAPAPGQPRATTADGVEVVRGLDPVLGAWRRPRRAAKAARADSRALAAELAGLDAALVWHMRGIVKPPLRMLHAAGIPVLYMLHDRWVLYERPGSVHVPWARLGPLAERLLREPPILSEGIVCFNSAWLRDEHARLGWRPRRAHVVPCGLPGAFQAVAERAVADGDREPSVPRRLLFAGRIDPAKGVEDAIAALARQPDEVTLAVAGPETVPGYRDTLRSVAAAAGVERRVEWLGELTRPQLLDAFASHDLFVYPSREFESFGLGILEGQAAGLPVVTSARGGPDGFLADGVNCLRHTPGDVGSLAQAVDRVRADRDLARRLRDEGLRTALAMGVDAVVDRVDSLLDDAVRGVR